MGGDKIVLLDGAGANGGGAAANGLLSMIPGMFANLIGGNKMDPNLVAALMNGRNNQDGFGGANGWWLWIIVLFWLWGGRGLGLSLLRQRERHRPAGDSLDVEMMSVLSTLASIQD